MPGMKLAKASQAEIDRLWQWLQARAKTDDPPPPFERVVFGYETLLQNCCDPAQDVLEWKPGTSPTEIAALERELTVSKKAYLDVADALCRESAGPDDLCRQARELRDENARLRRLGHAFADFIDHIATNATAYNWSGREAIDDMTFAVATFRAKFPNS